jgi:hypothetical protein
MSNCGMNVVRHGGFWLEIIALRKLGGKGGERVTVMICKIWLPRRDLRGCDR